MSYLQDQYKGFLQTPNLLQKSYDSIDLFELDIHNAISCGFPTDVEINENLRLGQRVEFFMEKALEFSNYEVLAKNLQVIQKKQTLGELDFILYDKLQDHYTHLEMMYKFYFYDKEASGPWPANWIGDNRRDSMYKKLQKLKTKQLPMLYSPATQSYLHDLGLETKNFKQKVLAKGQLYLAYGQEYSNEYINPEAITGYWLKLDELKAIRASIDKIHLPFKNNWIVTPQKENYEWRTLDELWPKLEWRISESISSLLWIQTKSGSLQRLFLLSW